MQKGIRKANKSDLAHIYELERLYILEQEPDQVGAWDQAIERMRQQLHQHLDQMFVKEKKNRVVAHGYWGQVEDNAHIYSLYVDQKNRRQGIASDLMVCLERSIYETGYEDVYLKTLEDNPARKLFDCLSYCEEFRHKGWIHYKKAL